MKKQQAMTEAEIVKILTKFAEEQGYKLDTGWRGQPRINFTKHKIQINASELSLYHLLHEVAHVLLGTFDSTGNETAKNEVLAESISIVVRKVLGFAPHPLDEIYVAAWLSRTGMSREAFFDMYGSIIEQHAKAIIRRIEQDDACSNPACEQQRCLVGSLS